MVPKKFGIMVVQNNDGELVPTRQTMGWRMCIDYIILNSITRKDHFLFPFIDQILKKLAGQSFYYFLDGILVIIKYLFKPTFTCPSDTFAYSRMPFGLCNAPFTLQICMMTIFSNTLISSWRCLWMISLLLVFHLMNLLLIYPLY